MRCFFFFGGGYFLQRTLAVNNTFLLRNKEPVHSSTFPRRPPPSPPHTHMNSTAFYLSSPPLPCPPPTHTHQQDSLLPLLDAPHPPRPAHTNISLPSCHKQSETDTTQPDVLTTSTSERASRRVNDLVSWRSVSATPPLLVSLTTHTHTAADQSGHTSHP